MTTSRPTPPDPLAESREQAHLLERTALALLRLELGLVPERAKNDARSYHEQAGGQFDGKLLVDFCLEGRAADGSKALSRGMNSVRSRVLGEAWLERSPKRRSRVGAFTTRVSAKFVAHRLFFVVQTLAILVLLVVLERHWPALDLYVLAERGMEAISSWIR